MGREYATIKQTSGVQQMRFKREGMKKENKREITELQEKCNNRQQVFLLAQ